MIQYKWWLKLVLRAVGSVTALAIVPVFMPRAWMAACHEMLGLGRFPDGPIVEYLARSTSLFYFFLGVMLWTASGDVRRHGDLVGILGAIFIMLGVGMLGIDVAAGMPSYWTAGEGPVSIVTGTIFLILLRRVRASSS